MRQIQVIAAILIIAGVGSALLLDLVKSPADPQSQINKFSSYDQLSSFLKENAGSSYSTLGTFASRAGTEISTGAPLAESSNGPKDSGSDYSTTNIQVSGVDEADIVKNDDKYIYTISNNKIQILDAYPAESAKILSTIELKESPTEIFVNKDKLVVFGYSYNYGIQTRSAEPLVAEYLVPPIYSSPKTFIYVYDISDRSNPVLTRNVTVDGNYFDSRMIKDYVYVITNNAVYGYTDPIPLPVISDNNQETKIAATDVYYFNIPDSSYEFTNVIALNTQDDSEDLSTKTYLMGYSQNMYVSSENIYIVYSKQLSEYDFYDKIIDEVIFPVLPSNEKNKINQIRESEADKYEKFQRVGEVFQDYVESLGPERGAEFVKSLESKLEEVQQQIAKEMEKTIIHKISIDGKNIDYKTSGEVPGYTLNQFSMDEHKNYFRIATTTGNWRAESLNHLYVLDDNLKTVGKLEDLASGERIYSVRFIGERGFMVTFRQIDPLFVIDLSDPSNPKVLGYLKIPGVSDYLHPYDENHIIGVGRDASEEGRIKGMKLSLFDVTDVSNPKEISKYFIGDAGTHSEALNDHKAFLFSKTKNLLVLPVRVVEGQKWNAFQGAYVFNLDLTTGFILKGKVTHTNSSVYEQDYYYDYFSEIRRTLYIDDVLYTISNNFVKMNNLVDLIEVKSVELN